MDLDGCDSGGHSGSECESLCQYCRMTCPLFPHVSPRGRTQMTGLGVSVFLAEPSRSPGILHQLLNCVSLNLLNGLNNRVYSTGFAMRIKGVMRAAASEGHWGSPTAAAVSYTTIIFTTITTEQQKGLPSMAQCHLLSTKKSCFLAVL